MAAEVQSHHLHTLHYLMVFLESILAVANSGFHCRYVVIVEKDAVFQRLVEEDFHLATSCILVTARGMPDMATRLFLQLLFQAYPDLIFTAGRLHS